MAEGWARALHGGVIEACSAGTKPAGLNRLAVQAMAEVGIDISQGRSKTPDECDPHSLHVVVTVCDHAAETCPVWPGETRVVHRSFEDPPRLAASCKSEAEAMVHYRRVRDEIRAFVAGLPLLVGQAKGFAEAK